MSDTSQARTSRRAPEIETSVDLSEGDPTKAVQRRAKPAPANDIAEGVRDQDGDSRAKSPAEREIFKRMTRFQRNMTKQFDQKLAEQQARHDQEISALRKQYEGVSVERGGEEAKSEHEAAMKLLEEKLAAANEKGDSVEAAKITGQMIRLDGAYHARLSGAKQRQDTGGDPAAGGTQQRQTQQQPSGPTAAGARFITANEDWWDDPDFRVEKAAASAIYLELCNDLGWGNNSDATFREVAKRLKAKFPDLDVVGVKKRGDGADPDEDEDDPDEGADRGQRRAAPANIQDRGSAQNARQRANGSGRRVLSDEERKTMIAVGLSPDNDKDVVQFLREAIALEASA